MINALIYYHYVNYVIDVVLKLLNIHLNIECDVKKEKCVISNTLIFLHSICK